MTTPSSIVPLAPAEAAAPGTARAGYGVSLNDVAAFEGALARAREAGGRGLAGGAVAVQGATQIPPPGQAMQALFLPLEQINADAARISAQAQSALDEGRALAPSEMVLLTMKCHEFMFHCQLTSNVANRTSDGLQQLFRQQA